MAEPKENVLMEKIVSLCKRRGFVFQSSEIYGGINGFWDYGPLGAELKRNVKDLWWQAMTRHREDVVGLEATIIMAPQIWRASGHVDTFADLMRECPVTRKRVRTDQVEPRSGVVYRFTGAEFTTTGAKVEKSLALLVEKGGHPESARKRAREFFLESLPEAKADLAALVLLGEQTQPVENSIDFHPDSNVELGPSRPFNLMLQTWVGPIQSDENVAYLRPETAQAIFAQFKNVHETSRQKLPFGIAQIGKAFRNEVTPRNFTFRSREFEQMELEFFIKPDEAVEAISGAVNTQPVEGHPGEPQADWGWQKWHQYWVEERVRFYEGIGLSRNTLGFHIQTPEELAHYARATTDILFKFPFSKVDEAGNVKGDELEGIAARSDFDLSQHERFSGKPMGVFDEELRTAWGKLTPEKQAELTQRYYEARFKYLTKSGVAPEAAEKEAREDAVGLSKGQYIPHVIEPSAGVDRLILALLANAYTEVTETDAKGKSETRVVMKFHPRVAPIKVGVFPLLKNKPELVAKAREIFNLLKRDFACFYDESGAIGRRYARQDEAGTPFCVTVDFDTLGEKPELLDTVTLRHRDDSRQERLAIRDLPAWLRERLS
ncbi:MAG: glycine--tRNA ligase [Verrucomicrobia bacterium]|nr:glycine--tRNA ligase [Verrucomicrobiota bacterium]